MALLVFRRIRIISSAFHQNPQGYRGINVTPPFPQKPAADFEQNPGANLLTKLSVKLRMFTFVTRFLSENSSYTSLRCTLHAQPHGHWAFYMRSAGEIIRVLPKEPLSQRDFITPVSVFALCKEGSSAGFANDTRQEIGNIFLPPFFALPQHLTGFWHQRIKLHHQLITPDPWFLEVHKHRELLKFFQLSICVHQLLCFFVIKLLKLCVFVLWIYYLDAFQSLNLGVFFEILKC